LQQNILLHAGVLLVPMLLAAVLTCPAPKEVQLAANGGHGGSNAGAWAGTCRTAAMQHPNTHVHC
jgi:hypothetical protein